jgi:hypothetical protein
MLFKGVCEATRSFQQIDPDVSERHLDLLRSALSPREAAAPLRGRAATLDDFARAYPETESADTADTESAAAKQSA